ncbi:MAG: hypothetical protein P794_00030 [Epsilonproteobacteria bacterium (ex Lamellibrachia satsuma)]|nr:MAG: hypothetical protein P794_00030 [Epsilonproteobacteria bacterium (ex Lamellibrachia satsuma)]
MYYITNENNQIIAIDSMLLAIVGMENIDDLYKEIALGNIAFSSSDEEGKVTITTPQNKESYHAESHLLSGMLGNITLVQLQTSSEETEPLEEETEKKKTENEKELFDLIMPSTEEDLLPMETLEKEEAAISEKAEEKNELFDLILPSEAESAIHEIAETEEDTSPIYVDTEDISQKIGISSEDYNTFLNEYIDTALSLEKDLQSGQEEKRTNAIDMLSHLSNVLHLPIITEIITQIENASEADQDKYIESLYATLARLTTFKPEKKKEKTKSPETPSVKYFSSINLDDVRPIHFDFQLEQAAKELNLPVELIEEFVHDYIKQAHEETEKMLEAYEKGDLKTLQKIGHLLKGAASNLRIEPLAETLYKIQFCEDITKMEDLIKNYWAYFLSLETQISLTSKK